MGDRFKGFGKQFKGFENLFKGLRDRFKGFGKQFKGFEKLFEGLKNHVNSPINDLFDGDVLIGFDMVSAAKNRFLIASDTVKTRFFACGAKGEKTRKNKLNKDITRPKGAKKIGVFLLKFKGFFKIQGFFEIRLKFKGFWFKGLLRLNVTLLYAYNGEIYLKINEIEGILRNNFGHRRI